MHYEIHYFSSAPDCHGYTRLVDEKAKVADAIQEIKTSGGKEITIQKCFDVTKEFEGN